MRRGLAIVMAAIMAMGGAAPLAGQDRETDRLADCGEVLKEILNVPDNIPQDLLDKAECIIVVPSTKKGAFIVGATYGRGAIVCRSAENFTGPWGAPAMFRLIGGSLGFQIGGQETDFVLLVMNNRGANSILGSKVRLGADASAAAGPKGRTATAATNEAMRAEVLTYSRARGLFAGISLEGANLQADGNANKEIYGRKITAREICRQGKVGVPESAKLLVNLLNEKSPKNLSEPSSLQ
ncbi:MAG TPA: lipid-binding SYLF domain-containing protein [Candidatus Acidoferrales bacterium]|nr:lipid-binding SYLF domain-containing protein [Candidatus Acidoferrales bacterium]